MKHSRFSDVDRLSQEVSLSIEEYQDEPLIPLKDAIKSLNKFVPHIQEIVGEIEQRCRKSDGNLTIDESAAIMLYTYEANSREKSPYFILNRLLRSNKYDQLKSWFPYLRLLIEALNKLPKEARVVYRVTAENLFERYINEKIIIWQSFSSCRTYKQKSNEKLSDGMSVRTVFEINCQTGRNIRKYAYQSTDDEIVLLPGVKFQVISAESYGEAGHHIRLVEIQSKCSFDHPISSQKRPSE